MSFLEVIETLASPCPVRYLSAGKLIAVNCKTSDPEWITFQETLDSWFGICYRLDLQGSVNKTDATGKANRVRLIYNIYTN